MLKKSTIAATLDSSIFNILLKKKNKKAILNGLKVEIRLTLHINSKFLFFQCSVKMEKAGKCKPQFKIRYQFQEENYNVKIFMLKIHIDYTNESLFTT